jgi:hypothetical protein
MPTTYRYYHFIHKTTRQNFLTFVVSLLHQAFATPGPFFLQCSSFVRVILLPFY